MILYKCLKCKIQDAFFHTQRQVEYHCSEDSDCRYYTKAEFVHKIHTDAFEITQSQRI